MNEEATEEEKDQTVKRAGNLLYFLVTDVPNKIRMAERRRAALKATLSRGVTPKGDPRLEFIHKSSSQIFGWLAAKALEYDLDNPHDTFTVNDLMDVLRMAQRKLADQIKKDSEPRPINPTSAS